MDVLRSNYNKLEYQINFSFMNFIYVSDIFKDNDKKNQKFYVNSLFKIFAGIHY